LGTDGGLACWLVGLLAVSTVTTGNRPPANQPTGQQRPSEAASLARLGEDHTL